jgi:hypothetical protein
MHIIQLKRVDVESVKNDLAVKAKPGKSLSSK